MTQFAGSGVMTLERWYLVVEGYSVVYDSSGTPEHNKNVPQHEQKHDRFLDPDLPGRWCYCRMDQLDGSASCRRHACQGAVSISISVLSSEREGL